MFAPLLLWPSGGFAAKLPPIPHAIPHRNTASQKAFPLAYPTVFPYISSLSILLIKAQCEQVVTADKSAILVSIIAILALIAADILSFRIARLFPPTAAKPAQQQASGQGSDELMSFAPILAKGLFGKATQGTSDTCCGEERRERPRPPAFNQSDFALLGTVQGSFRESFALIQKISSKEERVFRMGDPVFNAGPLVTVKKEYVELLAGKVRTKIFTPVAAATAAAHHLRRLPAVLGSGKHSCRADQRRQLCR